MAKRTTTSIAIAALAVDLGGGEAPSEFRFIPAGEFRSRDGRPTECPAWVCTEEDGRRVVAELAAQSDAAVIDWEHATLRRKEIGKAPAAGWFKDAEWRDDGIWLKGVDWTALAAQEIVNKEYRYVSPVFSYDQKTGRVLKVFHAALTNFAGIDGLTDLAACAAEVFNTPTENPMNEELLERWRWILKLPEGATVEEIIAQMNKVIDQIKAAVGESVAAAGFDLMAMVNEWAESKTKIAALSAEVGSPDPAKFVPIAMFNEANASIADLSAQVATLSAGDAENKVDALVDAALGNGKLTPVQESWARDLGRSNLAALTAYLDTAVPIVIPGKKQTTGGTGSGDTRVVALSASTQQIARAGGWDESIFTPKE